jgi:hypothetical protein
MKNLILQIPMKPLSANQKYTIAKGSRRITKKSQVYAFEREIKHYMMDQKDKVKFFVNNMLSNECLKFEVVVYIPKNEFYNKKGTINLKCLDASNVLKILEDSIYQELGKNDGLNTFVSSEKRPYAGDDFLTLINITRVPTPSCDPLDSLGKLAT